MTDFDTDDLAAGELEIDRIPIRRLELEDLDAVVKIDETSTGIKRQEFYRAKLSRALEDSSVQLSLAAELDGMAVGFLIVTFYYGEFGLPETIAVIEAIGVHPEYRGQQVARALMRQLEMNLGALGVETVRTEVSWDQLELVQFLAHFGFEPAPRFCLQKKL